MSLFIFKLRAKELVDREAGEARRTFVTDISDQERVYAEKYAEATAYVQAQALNPSTAVPGPYITEEAEETGQSPIVVANIIIASATARLTKSPLIEARRVAGKARIDNAATELDILAERDLAISQIRSVITN